MTRALKIANGAGFLGDNLDAPRRLVESAAVDYLTLEYLAELTLSILARQRSKDPSAGYATDFLTVLASLVPALKSQSQLRIVTNAGGMNPRSCARAVGSLLLKAGLGETPIGVASGDDIFGQIAALQAAGCRFENCDTGEPLSQLTTPVVSANVYLGAQPIAAALAAGARIVITGRVADASLTLGPAMHEFGWPWNDWRRLAGASVAGHLIECGAQVTGGYSTDWRNTRLEDIGYPIAEIADDGSAFITKPAGSGGRVTRDTVIEQLIYEIGDPAHYLTPDVDVNFTTVEVVDEGADRVLVRGATGAPAPPTLKVSLAYEAGYMASGQLLVYGQDCQAKAEACAEIIRAKLGAAGYHYNEYNVELLGAGAGVPGLPTKSDSPREVMLRISVRHSDRGAVERFNKEFAPLITSGPAGLAGYASGRSPARQVLAYWPTLIPRELVQPIVETRPASDW
jgi:hypothetical protein